MARARKSDGILRALKVSTYIARQHTHAEQIVKERAGFCSIFVTATLAGTYAATRSAAIIARSNNVSLRFWDVVLRV